MGAATILMGTALNPMLSPCEASNVFEGMLSRGSVEYVCTDKSSETINMKEFGRGRDK